MNATALTNRCPNWLFICWRRSSLVTANLRELGRLEARCNSEMAEDGMPAERLLKLAEVSRRVGFGKTMIYAMIKEGRFPAPYKISPFAARWSEREVVAWIDDVKDGFEGKRRKL